MEHRLNAPASKEKIHIWWMTALIGAGVVLGTTAFFITGDPHNLPIWQSILTNFGTGLVSAGLLLLVEPKLRTAVKTSVAKATVEATANMRDDIRKDVQDDIDEKLASLEQRIESSVRDKITEQDRQLADFAEDFTYTSALAALRSASEIESIYGQELIVQASDVPGDLRIGLKLGLPAELRGEHSYSFYGPDDEVVFLTAYTNKSSAADVEVQWTHSDHFGSATASLLAELTRTGGWGMGRPISWRHVTDRLVAGLKIAIDSRREIPGALHLQGRLIEIIGSEECPWYVTDQGIECPNQSYSLPRKTFPPFASRGGYLPSNDDIAPKPDFADPEEWSYVLGRGSDLFTFAAF